MHAPMECPEGRGGASDVEESESIPRNSSPHFGYALGPDGADGGADADGCGSTGDYGRCTTAAASCRILSGSARARLRAH